jgi:hypothetical protein
MAEADRPREGFAGRWSRLKAEARAVPPTPASVAQAEPRSAALPVAPDAPQAEKAEAPAQTSPAQTSAAPKTELPPLDTLTKDSDFSLFMNSDVADDTRKQALRKLWTMDPHFATIDISECHSIDFNAVPTFPNGLMNTIYRVGSGMVEAVEEIERKEAAEKAAAEKVATVQADSPDKAAGEPT